MGMAPRLGAVWGEANSQISGRQPACEPMSPAASARSRRCLRMVLQSAVLGLGAYLVIEQKATAGIIIASSILTARALAPVELAIANWKGFVAARQSWRRLNELLGASAAPRQRRWSCPRRPQSLVVEGIAVVPPGGQQRRSCRTSRSGCKPATGSASSARAPPASPRSCARWSACGRRCAARSGWTARRSTSGRPSALGRHIGYLPQDVELFAGTVAQNIARFDASSRSAGDHRGRKSRRRARADPAPARRLRDPDRRRRRGALGRAAPAHRAGARALWRSVPGRARRAEFEPRHAKATRRSTQAILGVRQRGGIVVVVAHRPSALGGVDHVLVMGERPRRRRSDRRDEVLAKAASPAAGRPSSRCSRVRPLLGGLGSASAEEIVSQS